MIIYSALLWYTLIGIFVLWGLFGKYTIPTLKGRDPNIVVLVVIISTLLWLPGLIAAILSDD